MEVNLLDESISVSSMAKLFSSFAQKITHDQSLKGTSLISAVSENSIEAAADSTKLSSSSKYRGVIPQPNGRWGAQIYEKHRRIWLGTFDQEDQAGKAYDIAVLRFRGQNVITNFKNPSLDCSNYMESLFLYSHSKAEIVDMLRKNSYADELEQSKYYHYNFSPSCDSGITRKRMKGNGFSDLFGSDYNYSQSCGSGTTRKRNRGNGFSDLFGSDPFEEGSSAREFLFEKVMTPSDVGKLNRVVIPKQHAEKHLPLQVGTVSKGVLLNFEDNMGNVWRFRYCYWSSSHSYVLTKGWSRFVKENGLKAGDTVRFRRSMGPNSKLFIDPKLKDGSGLVEELKNRVDPLIPVQSGRVIRLFGVNILESPEALSMRCKGNKRLRDMEVVLQEVQ